MAEGPDLGLLISSLVALIPGLVIHSFIIGVNVNDWRKGRSVTAVDLIVTSVCISRMSVQCSFVPNIFVDMFFMKNLFSVITLFIMGILSTFFIYANFWLTALLSIVFCLKISNLQTRLFLYLRRMILQRTAYLIVISMLLSAFSCLMVFYMTVIEKTKGETNNVTMDNALTNCSYNNSIYIYSIGNCFPLLFCCISSVLLFTSLYYHTTRMKRSSNVTNNLETYYSVMKFVSFTFIYNTMYFIINFVTVFYYCFYCLSFPWVFNFLGFLPTLHSSYLIYRTAKLRGKMSKVLHNVIDVVFQRQDRGNMEVTDQ